jgi:hypothetical protein
MPRRRGVTGSVIKAVRSAEAGCEVLRVVEQREAARGVQVEHRRDAEAPQPANQVRRRLRRAAHAYPADEQLVVCSSNGSCVAFRLARDESLIPQGASFPFPCLASEGPKTASAMHKLVRAKHCRQRPRTGWRARSHTRRMRHRCLCS